LNEYKILAHLAKEVVKERDEQISFLASGRAESHSEYRHVCGVIRGLTTAESFINDLVQRLENNDD
jgi:hypothetical protein